jgi:hypothetical protein
VHAALEASESLQHFRRARGYKAAFAEAAPVVAPPCHISETSAAILERSGYADEAPLATRAVDYAKQRASRLEAMKRDKEAAEAAEMARLATELKQRLANSRVLAAMAARPSTIGSPSPLGGRLPQPRPGTAGGAAMLLTPLDTTPLPRASPRPTTAFVSSGRRPIDTRQAESRPARLQTPPSLALIEPRAQPRPKRRRQRARNVG